MKIVSVLVQTVELMGDALDWVVRDIEFERLEKEGKHVKQWVLDDHAKGERAGIAYSEDWLWGGQIVEREKIGVVPDEQSKFWYASLMNGREIRVSANGDTPLVAAMRSYVLAARGIKVSVPDSLLRSETV